ncbi:MAG: HIT family protein [Agarilytica sp.]
MFELHEQLKKDTIEVGQFNLSLVLLHKDANYPWVILVPKRESMREIHHLAQDDQLQLIRESSHLSEVMTSLFAPTTMNIAALGNIVPQLHVHHVARFEGDAAWPKAVWGAEEAKSYEDDVLAERLNRLHASLVGEGFEAECGVGRSSSSATFTP